VSVFPLAPERYLVSIAADSALLADAAALGAGRALPSCPGWDTDTLLGHLGLLHRRVAAMVAAPRPTRVATDDLPPPPAPGKRDHWFRDGAASLVAALTVAGTARACWTLDDPEGESAFWFRRMAQETLMHRVDAELAVGPPSEIEGALAADGVDEALLVHLPRRLRRGAIEGLAAEALVEASDEGSAWRLSLTADAVRPGNGEAGETLAGPAAALLCYLWNRGDAAALTFGGAARVFPNWSALVQM